ncbi:T9SS type A sorting domain-containing protein, partial [Balneolaceae bacterium YR4-1]
TLTSEPIKLQVGSGGGDTTSPDTPSLVSPSDGATGISTSPTLDWNSVGGANTYRVQLSSSSDFSSIEADQSGLTATQWEVSGLANSTSYYWRVQASNSYGSSSWSVPYDFTTEQEATSPPAAPTLTSPADGESGIVISPNLDWDTASGAETYRVQVATSSDFSSPVVDQRGLTGTSQTVSGLANITSYFWRVQAANSAGTGSWSSVWSFTTESGSSTTIPVPVPTSPADGASGISLTPSFSWEPVSGADYYILHANRLNPSEMVIEEQVSGTSFTPSKILDTETAYDWRVRAVVEGVEGDWSSICSFTTGTGDRGTNPPAAPQLTSPSDMAIDQSTTLILDWQAAADAETYRVQVATSSDFNTVVAEQSGLNETQWEVSGLANATTYFWRAQATNSGGVSNWSTVWSFITGGKESETETTLEQNYPNPFNPSTQIRFTLGKTQKVSLKVYDTVGRQVAVIVEGTLTAGSYERTFRDDNLASGVYFIRFVTESRILTSQMTLMK